MLVVALRWTRQGLAWHVRLSSGRMYTVCGHSVRMPLSSSCGPISATDIWSPPEKIIHKGYEDMIFQIKDFQIGQTYRKTTARSGKAVTGERKTDQKY